MRRDDLIAELKANADVIRSDGVGGLYLFGSHARDEATANSDVDLFFDRDPETGCVARMTACMRISSGTSPTGICRI